MEEEADRKKAATCGKTPKERPTEYYGKYVFNRQKMFEYLPKKTYDALVDAIDNKRTTTLAKGRRQCGRRHEAVGRRTTVRATTPAGSIR